MCRIPRQIWLQNGQETDRSGILIVHKMTGASIGIQSELLELREVSKLVS